jgi:hypothetical protein
MRLQIPQPIIDVANIKPISTATAPKRCCGVARTGTSTSISVIYISYRIAAKIEITIKAIEIPKNHVAISRDSITRLSTGFNSSILKIYSLSCPYPMPQTGRKTRELGISLPWLVILYGSEVDIPSTQGRFTQVNFY